MDILNVVQRFYPSIGGAENCVYHLSKGLIKKNHKVTVFTSNYIGEENTIQPGFSSISGINVFRFRGYLRVGAYILTPGMIRLLIKANFDIVHTHSYGFFHTDISSFVKRITKKFKLVFTAHGFYPGSTFVGGIIRPFYDRTLGKSIVKNADALVALTNDDIAYYEKFGAKKEQIYKIPNGIEEEFFIPPDERSKDNFLKKTVNKKENKIILSVGRIEERRGFQYVLKSLKYLKKRFDNLKFLIVGVDWGFKKRLIELIEKYDLKDNVIFAENLNRNDLKLAYYTSDIFALTSTKEAFSLTLLEAMAAGKPIIASNVGGTPEVVEESEGGIIVDIKKNRELTEAFERYLKDENLAKIIGKKNRSFAREKYSWDRIVEKSEKMYFDILSK